MMMIIIIAIIIIIIIIIIIMRNSIKTGGLEGNNDWLMILGLKKVVQGLRLQCSDGPSDKVSNVIRRHIDSMKLLLIYSLGSIFLSMYISLYSCLIL